MNIAIFTDTYKPQVNGVVSSIESFCAELKSQGHNIFIFAPKMKTVQDMENVFYFRSIPYFFQPEHRIALPGSRQLFKFSSLNIDIIHSQTPFSLGELGLALSKLFKIPVVHTYHTLFSEYVHYVPFAPKRWTKKFAEMASRRYCNACKLVIVPSIGIKNILESYGVRTKTAIIPSGVDIFNKQEHCSSSYNIREKHHFDTSEKILLYAGRIGKEKNLYFLLDVFSKIKQHHQKVKFIIVGDGPEKKRLKREAKKQKISHNIIFTGYLEKKEVFSYYQEADIFVFASKTETQGLVIAEAMSVGLPVIALEAIGVSDILADNQGGFMIKKDINEFSEKIELLLNNKSLLKNKSSEAKDKAKQWTTPLMTSKLIQCYKEIIDTTSQSKI